KQQRTNDVSHPLGRIRRNSRFAGNNERRGSWMPPELGRKAPDFTLPSVDGSVKLSDYRGKKVVLYFYPHDMTPTCTQQACEWRDAHMDVLANDAVVIGISTDELDKHEKFAAKYELPFLLLSDPKHKVCEKYGVWQLKKLYGRE